MKKFGKGGWCNNFLKVLITRFDTYFLYDLLLVTWTCAIATKLLRTVAHTNHISVYSTQVLKKMVKKSVTAHERNILHIIY